MAENLVIPAQATKAETYQSLLPQIRALVADEPNVVANLANVAAALREAFGFFWVGFYLVENDQLVLGPFQGPVACTRIAHGRGVCGTAWAEARSIIVANVHEFPGHIACSAASQSEIVVPVVLNGEVKMVLDIDSDQLNAFDSTDQLHLEALAEIIAEAVLMQGTRA